MFVSFLEDIMSARAFFQPDWPGFDFVFFDCDSTLSSIEGIDELARQKGKFNQVKQKELICKDFYLRFISKREKL